MSNVKKARSEGNRVACAIKANKSSFYIADVDLEDSPEDVMVAVESVSKTLGKTKCSFMLISAGISKLIVATCCEENGVSNFDDWLSGSYHQFEETYGKCEFDTKGQAPVMCITVSSLDTPFKFKDTFRGVAFKYLRDKGLMTDNTSDEEEECYEFE